jgi:IclR family pca regulon transcriptional regulator
MVALDDSRYFLKSLASLTHRTINNEKQFRRELTRVRCQGYAINDVEVSVGLRSVSTPIMNADGHAIAALNIAVPTKRVSRKELKKAAGPFSSKDGRQNSKDTRYTGRQSTYAMKKDS